MKCIRITCVNEVDATPEVIKWNSWDSEHLASVHGAYDKPIFLFERKNEGLYVDNFKIPLLGLRVKAMVFTTQVIDNRQITYTVTPFFIAKNSIEIERLSEKKSRVTVHYDFSGGRLQALLFPIYKYLIRKWNKVVWQEDLPLKLRRQKALEYGFVDWIGLPEAQSDRQDRSQQYKVDIPIPRSKSSDTNYHEFFEKF